MIKKLSQDGPIVMHIQSARQVEGNYGTQIEFVGMEAGASEDTVLYISERSAARQLERLSIPMDQVAGQTLRFEQVQKDGKSYNNIYRAEGGAPTQAGPMPTTSAPAAPAFNSIYDLYAECLSNAAKMTLAMSEETGVTVTGSDVIAAAATLFIQSCRR